MPHIFEYLDPGNFDAPTGIVYIASSPMFHGLKLAPILSSLLLFHCHSCILFASTSPINEDWYVSQQFEYVNPDNKFDNDEFPMDKEFVSRVFQYWVCHSYLHKESGLQYDKDGNECDFLRFIFLEEFYCNDKYIATKWPHLRDLLPLSTRDLPPGL